MRDLERWKDKVELSLDGRQIFFLFFGSAVAACLIFVSGMLVGKRIERRTLVAATQTAEDPLAALDQLGAADDDDGLTFHQTLAAADHHSAGKHDDEVKRKPESPSSAKPEAPKVSLAAAKPEVPKVILAVAKPEGSKVGAAGAPVKAEPAQEAGKVALTEKAPKVAPVPKPAKIATGPKSAKSEAPQKLVKTENPQKIAKTESSQKSVKTELPLKLTKTVVPQKLAKPEIAQKSAKMEKTAKSEVAQKQAPRLEKGGKPVDGSARIADVAPVKSDKGKERFTLQLSAFPDRGEAEQFLQKMQSAGYKPFLVQSDVPGHGVYFRVRVGDYSNRKAAADAKADFERRQHLIAYVAKL